jgi:ribosomal-protein-alanine N-acetyltransferase
LDDGIKNSEMNYFEQESERLIYRKLTRDDIPNWVSFFENNNMLRFVGILTEEPHEELAKKWIEKQLDRYQDEGLGMLAVIEKTTNELIGLTGIIPREVDEKHYLEIGYSYKPTQWGKGFASEASQQMKKFGFESGLSDQFISIIDVDNYPSQAVARKNNMEILFKTTYLEMEVFIFGTTN